MASPKGYSSYRGRKVLGKIILAIILILVIIAAAGFLLLQKYIVYDDSGMPYFKLPEKTGVVASSSSPAQSGAASAGSGAASSQDDLQITIDQPGTTGTGATKVFQLGRLPLTDWDTVHSHLQANAGVDSVALTVKDASGTVYYDSLAAAGVSGRAVKIAADTTASISGMTSSEYSVARLSCFLDPLAANADLEGMGLKNTGGYIFYDGNNTNWLDPAKASARQYLENLAVECAKLGFKEILLTNVSYPTVGKLNKIEYGATLKNENLNLFLTELQSALSDYDVKISLELPAAVITGGSDENAGQVLSEMAAHVDRIYAVTTADQAPALSSAVTAANAKVEFIPEVTAAGSLTSYMLLNG